MTTNDSSNQPTKRTVFLTVPGEDGRLDVTAAFIDDAQMDNPLDSNWPWWAGKAALSKTEEAEEE